MRSRRMFLIALAVALVVAMVPASAVQQRVIAGTSADEGEYPVMTAVFLR